MQVDRGGVWSAGPCRRGRAGHRPRPRLHGGPRRPHRFERRCSRLRPARELPGHQGLVPPGATLVGPAPTTTALPLVVTLKPRDPSALAAEVQAVSDPESPEYRHFLTPTQFAQRFGATPATIAQVTSALQQEGLTVGTPSATGLSLPVTSTVAPGPVRLLHADLEVPPRIGQDRVRQRHGTRGPSTGGATDPRHPRARHAQPAPAVHERARGDRRLPHARRRGLSGRPWRPASPRHRPGSCASSISSVQATYGALDAPELAQAYSFGSALLVGRLRGGRDHRTRRDARGGVFAERHQHLRRLLRDHARDRADHGDEHRHGGGRPRGRRRRRPSSTSRRRCPWHPRRTSTSTKAGLSNSLYDVFSQIVSDDTAKVVSASWTNGCEAYVGQSVQNSENTLFQAAAAEGQSIFVATGDQGAEGCNINGRDLCLDRLEPGGAGGRSLDGHAVHRQQVEQYGQRRQRGEREQSDELRHRRLGPDRVRDPMPSLSTRLPGRSSSPTPTAP